MNESGVVSRITTLRRVCLTRGESVVVQRTASQTHVRTLLHILTMLLSLDVDVVVVVVVVVLVVEVVWCGGVVVLVVMWWWRWWLWQCVCVVVVVGGGGAAASHACTLPEHLAPAQPRRLCCTEADPHRRQHQQPDPTIPR
jgi:hypothetical protein